MSGLPSLTPVQQRLLATWFDGLTVVADLSWGLVDTVVLHVRGRDGDVIVKAAGPADRDIGREIAAHRSWTGPWIPGSVKARARMSAAIAWSSGCTSPSASIPLANPGG